MKRTLTLVVCVAVLFSLSACFEMNQELTLNPDGSGKVVHRVIHADQMGEGEKALASIVIDQLGSAKGVDAWSDVSASITEGGSILFQGTAYFHDLNELELADADQIAFRWSADDSGGIAVTVARDQAGSEAPTKNARMSETAIAAAVRKQRSKWKQSRAMAAAAFDRLRWHTSFRLPAPIKEVSGFELVDQRTVALDLDGETVMAALDELAGDDAFMRRAALEGTDLLDFDMVLLGTKMLKLPYEAVALMFGDSDQISVTTALPGEPLFDYAAEMNAAKAGYDAMIASLPDIGNTVARKLAHAPPPPAGAGFHSLRVIGASYELKDYSPPEFRTSIKISGVLPRAVFSVDEGTLRTLVTDGGLDLLPNAFGVITNIDGNDRTAIEFDVGFRLPDRPVKGFREISGVIPCKVLSGTSRVDLGFNELAEGATGTRFDARITRLEPKPDEESEAIELEIGLPSDEIEGVEFTDADGRAIEARLTSAGWRRDVPAQHAFLVKGEIPRDGHIIATLREGKSYEIPFKIENVDLLGYAIK